MHKKPSLHPGSQHTSLDIDSLWTSSQVPPKTVRFMHLADLVGPFYPGASYASTRKRSYLPSILTLEAYMPPGLMLSSTATSRTTWWRE